MPAIDDGIGFGPSDLPELTEALAMKIEELLDHAELVNVRPFRMEASCEETGLLPRRIEAVRAESVVRFAVGAGFYANRVEYEFELGGPAEVGVIGAIGFGFLVEYRLNQSDLVPDRDAAAYVAHTTGYFATYPYARECLQSLASRLQLDAFVLGILRHDALTPNSVAVMRRPS